MGKSFSSTDRIYLATCHNLLIKGTSVGKQAEDVYLIQLHWGKEQIKASSKFRSIFGVLTRA